MPYCQFPAYKRSFSSCTAHAKKTFFDFSVVQKRRPFFFASSAHVIIFGTEKVFSSPVVMIFSSPVCASMGICEKPYVFQIRIRHGKMVFRLRGRDGSDHGDSFYELFCCNLIKSR